ncbi:hypothetical protein GCM10010172_72380 [Paractinoplanes ferrugineus]|uniref:Fibronectin type-III domain-containing protein n=1 Tax=Paractinoplanes ferrugineus TaxID=113564 RepID=A0A919J176_9ACTN|nr:hypothetical protein Afe05nite_34470 [Actinoplanes ferrugineus]
MLERAVELGKINLSEDDPDVLATAYQLGTVLQKADDPMAARRVLEEAYAAGLWRLGDANALMLEISHDIGVVAEELGNRHEARKAFSRVAELGPATLGAGHQAVARARAYLGQETPAEVRDGAATQPQSAPPLPSMPSDSTWQPRFTSANPPPAPAEDPPTPVGLTADQGTDVPAGEQEPPAPDSQQVRSTTPDVSPAQETPPNPLEEPTAVHPAITPRGDGGLPRPGVAPVRFGTRAPRQDPGPGYFEPQAWGSPPTPTPAPQSTVPPPTVPQSTAPQSTVPPTPVPQSTAPPTPAPHPLVPQQGEPAIIRSDSASPVWGQGAAPAYSTEAPPSSYQKRGMGIFAAIAAVLAAVIAVAALVFVLADRSSDRGDNSDVPTLGGSPPAGVKIVDNGSTIKITWVDPTDGTVSFLVAMGHPGEQLKPVTTLGPGQTTYEVSALNPALNYCFAVVAVYRNNKFATSQQACTSRPAPSATQ